MTGERCWDQFLTERDVQHLALSGEVPRVGRGRSPALLLVDNYRAALGPRRLPLLEAIETHPAATGLEGWAAIDAQADLLTAARACRIPIVHVTAMYPVDTGINGWWHALHTSSDDAAPDNELYELIEPLRPAPGEVVLRKTAPSAFFGTPLASVLTQLGIDTLLICGESTSGCVRATVQDAASYRYRTTVVEDCVYDRHEAAHAMNLFDMHQKFADVVPSHDIKACLRDLK